MEHIKNSLDAFLSGADPGVLAIKGDWGVGKTYFIEHYLEDKPDLAQNKVSFVSLFGLSTVEEVRRQIIPSAVSRERLRSKESNDVFKSVVGMVRKLPKVSELEGLFQSIENFAIRDLLVVFDDLERKSDNLALKDFLGFVNFLSEHSNSKVVLILNEDQLTEADKAGLAMFREKLIDKELLFAPTYEDNARIFFHDSELFETAVTVFARCDCRNLRVIKRCFAAAQQFRTITEGISDARQSKLLRQVLLLSCAFYRFGGRIDFSALGNFLVLKMQHAKDGKAFRGAEILKKISFAPSDDDSLILQYLETGIIDDTAIAKLRADDEKYSEFSKVSDELRAVYGIFNSNFGGTALDFRNAMDDFLERNADKIGWSDLGQAVNALRSFGYAADADKWLGNYVQSHADRFSLEQCNTFAGLSPDDAIAAVTKRKTELLTGKPPKEVIWKIVHDGSWSQEDTALLDNVDAAAYASWLQTEKDDDLLQVLREFVQTFNPGSANPQWRSIGEKLFEALKTVVADDPFKIKKITDVIGLDATALFPADEVAKPQP